MQNNPNRNTQNSSQSFSIGQQAPPQPFGQLPPPPFVQQQPLLFGPQIPPQQQQYVPSYYPYQTSQYYGYQNTNFLQTVLRPNNYPNSLPTIQNQHKPEDNSTSQDNAEDEKALQIKALKNTIKEYQRQIFQLQEENNFLRESNNKLNQLLEHLHLSDQSKESQNIQNSEILNQSQNILPQLLCQQDNHKQSQIKFICLNDQCENSRLLCKYCWRKKNQQNEHPEDLRELEEYFNQSNDQFKKFNLLKTVFQEISENSKKFQDFLNNQTPSTLQIQLQLTSQQLCAEINKFIKIKKLFTLVKDQHWDKAEEFSNFMKQIHVKEILNQSLSSQKFQFSQNFKQKQCTISSKGSVAILRGGQGFALCEPSLNSSCFKLITIKIIECGINIYFGIGDQNILEKLEYNPELKQLDHGTQIIDAQGYMYTHDEKNMNQVQTAFKFQANDEIQLEVDEFDQCVKWTKKSDNQQFIMKYKLKGALYFVVGLNEAIVEIVYSNQE